MAGRGLASGIEQNSDLCLRRGRYASAIAGYRESSSSPPNSPGRATCRRALRFAPVLFDKRQRQLESWILAYSGVVDAPDIGCVCVDRGLAPVDPHEHVPVQGIGHLGGSRAIKGGTVRLSHGVA